MDTKTLKIGLILFGLTGLNVFAHSPDKLPLGDGKLSNEPKVGYIWNCDTRNPNILGRGMVGAHREGFWIDKQNKTWDSTIKPMVEGNDNWDNSFLIKEKDNQLIIITNGLPNHNTGQYPIRKHTQAFQYDRNPNSIKEQSISMVIPKNPIDGEGRCLPPRVGIMKNGVILLNALDLPKRDAPAHEIQDSCDGHPEERGVYHYHNLSKCLKDKPNKKGHSEIMGFAIDGFGIYGKYSNHKKITNEDLDGCHGHKHKISWLGKEQEMYHYHSTDEYPYTLGCLKGK